MSRVHLGRGRLSWDGAERRSDRYGSVQLWGDGDSQLPLAVPVGLDGVSGRLVCVVVATRPSPHIGDLFRCIYPTTPAVGQEVVLGEGSFFHEHHDPAVPAEPSGHQLADARTEAAIGSAVASAGLVFSGFPRTAAAAPCDTVGLRPGDGRESDWLDPHQLYKVHAQTVDLFFEPAGQP